MIKVDRNRSDLVDQKFRPLKKMMKQTSKNIAGSVANRQLPSSSVMGEFMAQVKVMVAYPGFGDEHYSAFVAACNSLYSAYKKKDLIVFGERFTAVIALKKECHHRYK